MSYLWLDYLRDHNDVGYLHEVAVELAEAAQALHERVEMDESVGVCLTSRVESMNLGALLAKVSTVQ